MEGGEEEEEDHIWGWIEGSDVHREINWNGGRRNGDSIQYTREGGREGGREGRTRLLQQGMEGLTQEQISHGGGLEKLGHGERSRDASGRAGAGGVCVAAAAAGGCVLLRCHFCCFAKGGEGGLLVL